MSKKPTHHFIYAVDEVKVSRTYGGCNYTFTVSKVDYSHGVHGLTHVGEGKACNRAHRGVSGEVWYQVIWPSLPLRLKKRMLKELNTGAAGAIDQYMPYSGDLLKYGIVVDCMRTGGVY